MTGILRKEDQDADSHVARTMSEHREKTAICSPRREGSGEIKFVNILIGLLASKTVRK